MPYTVFALKWRPKNFDEIVGQRHIVSRLREAILKNRLGHAFLFAGPRGVGKTSTARILARALNCQAGPTVNPCGKCPPCLEISEGRGLDVIEIDGASNTGVENIRDLREAVKFAPTSGRFKIYIIDEVHMLSDSAFNALLKTLEEPPPYVKFIFATTHPDEIIPTVLSRCQRFDFRRIPALEIADQLGRIAAEEKITVDKEVLFAIAKSSDGSLRDAESVLDQLASVSHDKVCFSDVVSVLGIVEQEALFELTDRLIHKDSVQALELLNRLIEEGKDPSVLLGNLLEHFRNLMIAKVARNDPKLIDLPEEVCRRLAVQAEFFSLEEIFIAFNTLLGAQETAKRLDSSRIPLEIGLIKLIHDKKAVSSLSATKQNREIKPAPSAADEDCPAQVASPAAHISLEEIKDAWPRLIEGLGKVKMSAATYLTEGRPQELKNNLLTISFPKNYSLHKESLEHQANRSVIEKVISDLFKARLKVAFVLSKEASAQIDSKEDSFIQSALAAFNGRLIKEE